MNKQLIPEKLSIKMIISAEEELLKFINARSDKFNNLFDLKRVELLVRQFIEENIEGVGLSWNWIEPKKEDMISLIAKCNLREKCFNITAPITFQEFIKINEDLLTNIFEWNSFQDFKNKVCSESESENLLGKDMLFRGFMGFILLNIMINFYNLEEMEPARFSDNDSVSNIQKSLLINTWWDNVVNFGGYFKVEVSNWDGTEETKFFQLRPYISTSTTMPDMIFINGVMLVDRTSILLQ